MASACRQSDFKEGQPVQNCHRTFHSAQCSTRTAHPRAPWQDGWVNYKATDSTVQATAPGAAKDLTKSRIKGLWPPLLTPPPRPLTKYSETLRKGPAPSADISLTPDPSHGQRIKPAIGFLGPHMAGLNIS
ncbi:hypothetical protein RRG08_017008 [Elysia crispata]|uniref:Uncharacterized protein n=1 Tax=Elysia crispata TaxID=231223 RepID=A0AAE0XYW3_9GAST|nr:hypothetical protein RRG08_017008 [Elysia crispata]